VTILKNKWFHLALISFGTIGIAVFLWNCALRYVERRFYTAASDPLRTINTAEEQYKASYPRRGYSLSLAELSGTTCGTPSERSACLIDQVVANASNAANAKSGYVYTYVAGPPNAQGLIDSYAVHIDPVDERHGTNHFYTDETGVERVEKGNPAGTNSPLKQSD
jgi:hypothetical protein